MQRLGPVGLEQKQPDAVEKRAGDRVVIAFAVAVHAADAFIEPADEARQVAVDIDIRPLEQQISGRAEMRLMGPFGTLERACDQPLAEMRDLGVGSEQAG